MRLRLCRSIFLGLAVSLLALTTPAAAQSAPTQAELLKYQKAPEAGKVQLLISMAQSGDHEFAARLLQEFPLQGNFADNRTLYIEGLIKKGRGDLTGAVANFRKVLAREPKLTRVRVELAKTLVQLDENDSAKHHLELLAADAPDENQAGAIRSFIDQVDARRPYQISGYVSLAPSTNVNSGANAKKVYASTTLGEGYADNPDAKKSGIGIATGVNAGFSRRIGNDWSFVAAAGAHANIFGNKDANILSLSQSSEAQYMIEGGYLSFGLTGSYANLAPPIGGVDDERIHSGSFGPRIALTKHLGLRDTLSASAVYEKRMISNSTSNDGTALLLNASLAHAFDSSFNVSFSAGFEKAMLESDQSSYKAISTSFSMYKEMPLGITVDASLGYRRSQFMGEHWYTPIKRKDNRVSGQLGLTKRDLNILGFAPSLSYTYVRNFSNVILNDYDSHSVDLRLTKNF